MAAKDDGRMRAVTLHQPWATWVAWGWKTIETRTHDKLAFLVGGRIAIHAGAAYDSGAMDMARDYMSSTMLERMSVAAPSEFVRGTVVATAFVWKHRRLTAADNQAALTDAEGRSGLVLIDIVALREQVACRGFQGGWRLPVAVEAEVSAQMRVAQILRTNR